MARSTRTTFLATLGVALILPAAAAAAPTAVDLRIEGATSTIFEGPVTTDARTVSSAAGGAHTCDATNGGAQNPVGPTPITALHDASLGHGFTWDGTFDAGFGDYFVTRIAGEAQDLVNFRFWGVFVNGESLQVGGCQFLVHPADEVLWSFDAFNKVGALKLAGPDVAQPGVPVGVKVSKIGTGVPVAGVQVGNGTTNAQGNAAVSFGSPGIFRVKAERADFIRSRALTICVDAPPAEPCTSGDNTAPSVRLDAPALASSLGRFGSVHLSWQGDDGPSGSGVRRYNVQYRRLDRPGTPFLPVVTNTTATARQVAADPGGAYEFRAEAFDRAAHGSRPATATTLVPLDSLSHRLKFSRRGWRTLARQGAYELAVARSAKAGASAKLAFTGTGATLVTRRLPFGGKARITLDGRSQVVNLRGKGGFRKAIVATRTVARGRHMLGITSVSRRPIEIDAVAIRP